MSSRVYVLIAAIAIASTGCSKSSSEAQSSASPGPTDTPTVGASAAASPTVSAEATVAAASAPAATASISVAFTDVAGNLNAPAITALAQLGVLGATSGTFKPDAPVMRRDFVRWLFMANNVYYAATPSKVIHPGTSDETAAFKDVATTDPDFSYIQGMSDSGISVGFPDGTFQGDRPITREQAIAIKALLDRGAPYPGVVGARNFDFARTTLPPWKDKNDVSATYVAAISEDTGNEGPGHIDNIGRTFGSIAVFRPKKTVTRGEASTLLAVIGDRGTGMRSAAETLAGPAAPSP